MTDVAADTAGCNKLKESAIPGWRMSLETYGRQYGPREQCETGRRPPQRQLHSQDKRQQSPLQRRLWKRE